VKRGRSGSGVDAAAVGLTTIFPNEAICCPFPDSSQVEAIAAACCEQSA